MSDDRADAQRLPQARHLRPLSRKTWLLAATLVGLMLGLGASAAQVAVGAWWPFFALGGVVVVYLAWNGARIASGVRRISAATALVHEGRVREAEAAFAELARGLRQQPVLHALVVYHLGACRVVLGRLDEAIALFNAARASGWLEKRYQTLHPQLLAATAMAYAGLGELAEARSWLAQAEQLMRPSRVGTLVPPRAFVAAREGQPSKVAEIVAESWSDAVLVLPAHATRGLRVLQAWGLAGTPEASADTIEALLEEARPRGEWDLDAVAPGWEPLRTFAEERGLQVETAP